MWRRHTPAMKRPRDATARDVQACVASGAIERPCGRPHDRVPRAVIRDEVHAPSAVFSHASSAAGRALDGLVDPVAKAEPPSPRPHRRRRLSPGEEGRILAASRAGGDTVERGRMFVSASETGLRVSEVVGLSRPEVVTADRGMCVVEREHKADEAHERRVWPSPAAEDVVTVSLEAPARERRGTIGCSPRRRRGRKTAGGPRGRGPRPPARAGTTRGARTSAVRGRPARRPAESLTGPGTPTLGPHRATASVGARAWRRSPGTRRYVFEAHAARSLRPRKTRSKPPQVEPQAAPRSTSSTGH